MNSNETERPRQAPCEHDWHAEHDCWDRDISRWQADHQHALLELEHIAQLVVSHGDALRHHAADLQAHKASFSIVEKSGANAQMSSAAMSGLSDAHAKCRGVHERIRRHHENAMSLLRALAVALRESV